MSNGVPRWPALPIPPASSIKVATGVCGDGRREVLGFAVGDSEDGAFWTAFLRSLKARGLQGVQLVIADAKSRIAANPSPATGGFLIS